MRKDFEILRRKNEKRSEKSKFFAQTTTSNVENRDSFPEWSFQIGSHPEINLNTTAWNSATHKVLCGYENSGVLKYIAF